VIVVVVEIGPEPPAELAYAAIDGCNGALGSGSCQLAEPGEAVPSEFHALVRADANRPGVFTIELRERGRDGRVLETRELTFAERDTPSERSTSLGVVIAALIAAQERRDRAASKPAASPPVPAAAPRPPPPVAPRPRTLRIDLGVTGTHALEESPLQLGALGRLSLVLHPLPLFLSAAAGYETRLEAQPSVAWLVGALGLGVRLGSLRAPLALELSSAALFERVTIEADDPSGAGGQEGATRWRFGTRWGADGVWSWSESLGVVAGAQLTFLRPSVVIEVRDEAVERAAAFSWGAFLGLRYSL
jgi:hypothetical protein